MEAIIVGTDGSSRGNPGPAGWAWIVNKNSWRCGALPNATSNVAEMTAVLRALRELPDERDVVVLSDSELTVKTLTVWGKGWQKAGGRKRDGAPVKNWELISEVLERIAARGGKTTVEWVRGHAGHPLNEAADKLATSASAVARSRGAVVNGPGWT